MINPVLKAFYGDEKMREEVRAFMVDILRELAADRAMGGESTVGIKEANECVDKTFDKLEEIYGIVKKPITTNSR
jgi:hypothetical protein